LAKTKWRTLLFGGQSKNHNVLNLNDFNADFFKAGLADTNLAGCIGELCINPHIKVPP